MAQFKVVLDGVELGKAETQRLNAAIQKTVLSELASVDRRGDKASVFLPKYGPIWWGIIAHPIDIGQIDRLGEINEQFDQRG